MYIPIDEMLIDLQDDPSDNTLGEVYSELARIGDYCEDEYLKDFLED